MRRKREGHINAYLEPEDLQRLDEVATDLGLTRSSMVRMLIKQGLRDYRTIGKQEK